MPARVSVKSVCASSRPAPGSLYHHFPSKQHLLIELIEEFYEELLATEGRIEQAALAKRDRHRQLIHAHLTLHQETPRHFRLVERDSGCLNEEQQRVRQMRKQCERKLLRMMRVRHRLDEQNLLVTGHVIFGDPDSL